MVRGRCAALFASSESRCVRQVSRSSAMRRQGPRQRRHLSLQRKMPCGFPSVSPSRTRRHRCGGACVPLLCAPVRYCALTHAHRSPLWRRVRQTAATTASSRTAARCPVRLCRWSHCATSCACSRASRDSRSLHARVGSGRPPWPQCMSARVIPAVHGALASLTTHAHTHTHTGTSQRHSVTGSRPPVTCRNHSRRLALLHPDRVRRLLSS